MLLGGGIDAMEKAFHARDEFARVLELGAGGPFVFRRVRHRFQEYVLSDSRDIQVEPHEKLRAVKLDAANLPSDLGLFDRIIAANLLEHLVDPETILARWLSHVRPGGVLSLLLPTDAGLTWRALREVSSRFHPALSPGEYRYVMAKEHVNGIDKLLYLLDYRYPSRKLRFFPFPFLPLIDPNVFVAVHIRKD